MTARETLKRFRDSLTVALQRANGTDRDNPVETPEAAQSLSSEDVKILIIYLEKLKDDVGAVEKQAEAQQKEIAERNAKETAQQSWKDMQARKLALQKEVRSKNVDLKQRIDNLRTLRSDLWALSPPEEGEDYEPTQEEACGIMGSLCSWESNPAFNAALATSGEQDTIQRPSQGRGRFPKYQTEGQCGCHLHRRSKKASASFVPHWG
eukprot:CAMPEP_0184741546 /NCGR_PEP_ID=MMETSP0315-20130426/4575_1 /TAXON_ID=101924 /ORGANISM="Rhodosorus marinus, Strain UTEX LB 2760" /LENGTH=207 /DNA_ID=CAMNT_0027211909 /DNA_START=158 /DNA_END=782 /DNA_ORIENTATION=+